MSTASSYWCYRCSRLVRAWTQDLMVCPDCDGGFLEEISTPPRIARQNLPGGDEASPVTPRIRRHRRAAGVGDRSPFNPVIVLRGPADGGGGRDADRFELYYDDGAGSGLRPLPPSMSEFLMGSGFERLLDQLAQIEMNGLAAGRRFDHPPPASKAAIESMPTVEISAYHVGMDCQCAVCMEAFEIGTEAREMPCKHMYHQDCIFPWLSLRNSCPICRGQMPADQRGGVGVAGAAQADDDRSPPTVSEDDTVGLTIWRLPGGGFAVGRFSSGATAGERQLPVVYTEMDGGFNSGGAPRRISWTDERDNRRNQHRGGGIGSVFRNLFSCFVRRRSLSPSSRSSPSSSSPSSSDSVLAASDRHRRSRVFRFNSGLPSVRQ